MYSLFIKKEHTHTITRNNFLVPSNFHSILKFLLLHFLNSWHVWIRIQSPYVAFGWFITQILSNLYLPPLPFFLSLQLIWWRNQVFLFCRVSTLWFLSITSRIWESKCSLPYIIHLFSIFPVIWQWDLETPWDLDWNFCQEGFTGGVLSFSRDSSPVFFCANIDRWVLVLLVHLLLTSASASHPMNLAAIDDHCPDLLFP